MTMYAGQQTQALDGQAPYARFAEKMTAGKMQEEACRVPELPAALERLVMRVHDIRDAIQALDGRLTGAVARTSPPANEPGAKVKGAMQTGVGTTLDNLHDVASVAHRQLLDLIDRLEF